MTKAEYWYYNKTDRNITIYDLDITLPKKKVVELKTLQPRLKDYLIRNSEYCGDLRRKADLEHIKKLSGPPKQKKTNRYAQKIPISNEPIMSRSRSVIEVSSEDKYFIEHLEGEYLSDGGLLPDSERAAMNDKFIEEEDLDGFFDPLVEDDSVE